MFIPIEYLLLGGSILLLLSVIGSTVSGHLGIPALLLFLLVGMLAGADGPGGFDFDNPWLAQSLGVLALALILFAGGLDTVWEQVRPVGWKAMGLATIGVGMTTALIAWFAKIVLDFSWLQGFLLGSIVSSTDAAAVFSVLRSKNVRLKGQLKPLLELESGSNDPMAVFLTLGMISLLMNPDRTVFDLVPMFLIQMTLGGAFGYGMGKAMVFVINRLRLEYEGLYPVLTLSFVIFTYGITATLGGSGFLAVYLAGLVLGNSQLIHKQSLMRFHDGLAWLMQIAMFLTLGLQVYPSQLVHIAGEGFLVALFLMVAARPMATFLTLLFVRMNLREKTMIAWTGLRGAAPIILALFPLLAGVPQAELMFNLVFFIVLTSVLIQGPSIPLVARWLKVESPPSREARGKQKPSTASIKDDLVELRIHPSSLSVGKQLVELGLSEEAVILLIRREHLHFIPNGNTVLQAKDVLLILVDSANEGEISSILGTS